jgi:hypothetical protein
MSVGLWVAWILSVIGAMVGSAMIVVAMIEEVPIIMRGTLQRTAKRQRRE